MRRSPHQLISGRGLAPVPRSLMQHARAQGSKEDGTLLQHGFFQPVMRIGSEAPRRRTHSRNRFLNRGLLRVTATSDHHRTLDGVLARQPPRACLF